ncbi:MAG TPA: class I SAM-dependent methyltransferase [Candidatus Polarisedimenticolia bacterium]|nr:class I SAM-dependent methyltransferase [Candidatus Polarisedimenticolia bacterium]
MDESYGRSYQILYENHWWWRSREAALLDVIQALKPPHGFGRILDVGCGNGVFFDRLRPFGETEGVESSAELLDPNGKHRARIHVAPFDARFQPGRRYGLVLMLDVLEHLPDPSAALRHALGLLEPGGKIVITVPAFRMLWTTHDDLNHHFTRYTKRSFAGVAREAGLRIDRARYWYQWTFPVKLAVRVAEKLLGSKPSNPTIPPGPINRALCWLSRAEQKLFTSVPAPFGSSLLVVGGAAESDPPG